MKKTIFILSALLLLAFGVLWAGKSSAKNFDVSSQNSGFVIRNTVILDAGHGGEDGGAVAPDGTTEKELNLNISNGIAAYFELFGVPYIPVRTVDTSVSDPGLTTIRERKRSDILNRFSLINNTPDSILLSIHQNTFSEAKYSGTQVFYAGRQEDSALLASEIKKSVTDALQPENYREIKPSSNSIYLLYNAKTTSVMVECGFLSNPAELERLKNDAYDSQMSYFIFKGLLNYLTL